MLLNRFKSNWKIKIHHNWLEKYSKSSSYPICVEIDPSNSCPLNCSYCCWAGMRNKFPLMIPEEKLLGVVTELFELGVKSIIWTGGGDPLTNPATIKAVVLSKKLGMDNGMFTNGILLDKQKSDQLSKSLNWIRFHVGGSDAKSYSINHGVKEEMFDLACKNIQYMSMNRKVDCGIGIAINSSNFEGVKDIPKLAMRLGIEYFQAKLDFGQIANKEYVNWWFSIVVPHFESLEKELGSKVKIHVFNDPIVRNTNVEYCHAHHIITAITADGRVAFCKMRRDQKETSIGNIYEKSLKEIFDGLDHKKISSHICPKNCPILASFCPYRTTNEAVDELVDLNSTYDIKHLNFF